MSCDEFLSRFSDFYDDGGVADRAPFEAHLAACEPCRRYLAVVERSTALARAMGESPVPPEFHEGLESRIHEERALRRLRTGTRGSGVSTGTVVAVTMLLSALAWAPSLRGPGMDVTLPTIVAATPPPSGAGSRTSVRPTSRALFRSLSPYSRATGTSELWGNTSGLLHEYSPLYGDNRASAADVFIRTLGLE